MLRLYREGPSVTNSLSVIVQGTENWDVLSQPSLLPIPLDSPLDPFADRYLLLVSQFFFRLVNAAYPEGLRDVLPLFTIEDGRSFPKFSEKTAQTGGCVDKRLGRTRLFPISPAAFSPTSSHV